MRLSALSFAFLALIPSFIFAATVPQIAPRNETHVKRGGEVNYLANCNYMDLVYGGYYLASYMAWYSNVDNSLNLQLPDSLSNQYRNGANYIVWEGTQQDIYFADSGVTVQTHIDADAQSRAFTDWAGWAQRTSDWKVFNCYKDNRRIFTKYHIEEGSTVAFSSYSISCDAMYWCV